MSDDLKPCPMCRSHNIEAEGVQVICMRCGVGTSVHDTLDAAIEAWNRRAAPEPEPVAWLCEGEKPGCWKEERHVVFDIETVRHRLSQPEYWKVRPLVFASPAPEPRAGVSVKALEQLFAKYDPANASIKPEASIPFGIIKQHHDEFVVELRSALSEVQVPGGCEKALAIARAGLNEMATSFYKCDQHQAYARHVLDAMRTAPPLPNVDHTHRHLKSGHLVRVLGIGRMQAGNWYQKTEGVGFGGVDMREVVIYEHDGSLWARPRDEFEDGRFASLANGDSEGRS